jgi:SSS family solute:Na+ symporter
LFLYDLKGNVDCAGAQQIYQVDPGSLAGFIDQTFWIKGIYMAFGMLDWIVLGVFMLALVGIVVWVALQKEEDTEDYFLAGRNATWLAIGASIFASNIGSEHLVGLASAGAQYGFAMAHWEFQSWIILMLAWIFVPFYWRTKIFTTPEFLERRYSPQTRTFFSFISLIS